MKSFEKNIDGKLANFYFHLLAGRSITETIETASCYTTYVISTTHHECISDSECDTNMSCCQNSGADYSVCVPHKDHVLPKEKSHQSLSSGQKMHHKDKGHVFHLPQPSPIPIPILEKATHKSKSWKNWTIHSWKQIMRKLILSEYRTLPLKAEIPLGERTALY